MGAAMAVAGAKTAADAAAAAVAGVMGMQDADAASFATASAKAQEARDAHNAGIAAQAVADSATDPEVAESAEDTAQAAQTAAMAARAAAETAAGMVRTAHQMQEEEQRQRDQMAIAAARLAATAAATAAEMSAGAADDAVDGVMSMRGADAASFSQARTAAQAAEGYSRAAVAAAAVAATATTPEAAQAAQRDAETARDNAADALMDAEMYAGMVTDAHDLQQENMMRVMVAQEEADKAAEAAKKAADDAIAAVAAVMAGGAADPVSFAKAEAARETAKQKNDEAQAARERAHAPMVSPGDAEMARMDAEMARDDAMDAFNDATMYSEIVGEKHGAEQAAVTAQEHADAAAAKVTEAENATMDGSHSVNLGRAQAEAAVAQRDADAARLAADLAKAQPTAAEARQYKSVAEAARDRAATATRISGIYADLVIEAGEGIDNETQRMADVTAARTRAKGSYETADGDAKKAEAAADEAEATSPGSPGAMAARTAATAARTAANNAKMAHDAIMDDMTKDEADKYAGMAATEAGNANSSYMTAKTENDAVQTAAAAAKELQRQRDIAGAKTAAGVAVAAALKAKNDAEADAMAAETARDDAEKAYNKAMAARRDSDNAKMQYEAAKTAATDARTAADAANTAYMAAKLAADGIDDEGTGDAAKMAQMTAETEQGKAQTAANTADMERMAAETAMGEAEKYAEMHVLRLFMAANGAHVDDDETTMAVNEKDAHVASVGAAMAAIAAATNGDQAASTTVTDTWPGDTVDNPATDPDEFAEGMRTMTVNVAGATEIVAELRASRAATDLNNDGDTTDDGEAQIIQTARKIADLGRFQGYEFWENDDDATTNTDRARAILFTNKQKGMDSVLAVTAATARSATAVVITTASELAKVTSTGTTITGVEWTPSGDTAPLTGTLTCPANTACDITLGADGAVSEISGYTFTGSRAAVEAVTAAVATENNNYLAFGLWLEESDDGTTDTFGAFAVGGTDYAVNVQNAVTGTATYTGRAAGAHHKTGEGVNWFHGDASLTANFGAIDTDAERGTTPPADTSPGTISGEISNIQVNGGEMMSDSIVLRQAQLTDGTATFNGNARMGAGEIQADDTVEYPYNGTWSGSFYGATADDDGTADVNESVTAPLAAAGTFGVTMTEGTGDDAVTESFVGAFGAHKQ